MSTDTNTRPNTITRVFASTTVRDFKVDGNTMVNSLEVKGETMLKENATVEKDLMVKGNLNVLGTLTTTASNEVLLGDRFLTLNYSSTDDSGSGGVVTVTNMDDIGHDIGVQNTNSNYELSHNLGIGTGVGPANSTIYNVFIEIKAVNDTHSKYNGIYYGEHILSNGKLKILQSSEFNDDPLPLLSFCQGAQIFNDTTLSDKGLSAKFASVNIIGVEEGKYNYVTYGMNLQELRKNKTYINKKYYKWEVASDNKEYTENDWETFYISGSTTENIKFSFLDAPDGTIRTVIVDPTLNVFRKLDNGTFEQIHQADTDASATKLAYRFLKLGDNWENI